MTVLCENVESRRKDKAGSAGFKAGLSEVNRFLKRSLKTIVAEGVQKGIKRCLARKDLNQSTKRP